MVMTASDLSQVIDRIVRTAEPQRIILFGSAARGQAGPDSDVDFLVVKEGAHRRRLAQAIYRGLVGLTGAVDVVVATPEDLTRYGESPGLVIGTALREGRVVYERPALP